MESIKYTPLEPPELPAGVADRIAAAVKIDKALRSSFAASLAGLFELARMEHAWDIKAARDRDLVEIQLGHLRELLTLVASQIDTLEPIVRKHFGLFLLGQWKQPPEGADLRLTLADLVESGGMKQGESIVSDYRAIIGEMLAAASTNVWPKRGDGRPPKRLMERPPEEAAGHHAVKAFDLFVVHLVELILDCGGQPRLNKNTGKGQLIDALRIAQPHLPKGLIPAGVLEPDEDGKHSGMSHLYYLRGLGMRRGQKRRPK